MGSSGRWNLAEYHRQLDVIERALLTHTSVAIQLLLTLTLCLTFLTQTLSSSYYPQQRLDLFRTTF